MSEQTETILGVLGIIGVAGWTVLQWLQKTDRERHEDLKDAISQQFKLAEQNRQTSSDYWREMFSEMRTGHSDISERLERLEQRVGDIELEIAQQNESVLKSYKST